MLRKVGFVQRAEGNKKKTMESVGGGMINKNKICRFIMKYIINPNSSKYLFGPKNQSYEFEFRDRQENTAYYRISLRGNYIRAYEIRYIDPTGNSVNTFMSVMIPALCEEKLEMPEVKKTLLCKLLFKDYKSFPDLFKPLTPSLEWNACEGKGVVWV